MKYYNIYKYDSSNNDIKYLCSFENRQSAMKFLNLKKSEFYKLFKNFEYWTNEEYNLLKNNSLVVKKDSYKKG